MSGRLGSRRDRADAQCALICVDVIDRDDEVVLRAAPGYKKEDSEISVSNSTLTITPRAHSRA